MMTPYEELTAEGGGGMTEPDPKCCLCEIELEYEDEISRGTCDDCYIDALAEDSYASAMEVYCGGDDD